MKATQDPVWGLKWYLVLRTVQLPGSASRAHTSVASVTSPDVVTSPGPPVQVSRHASSVVCLLVLPPHPDHSNLMQASAVRL